MKFNIVKEVGLCGDRSNENKKFRTQVSDRSANSNGQDFLILPPRAAAAAASSSGPPPPTRSLCKRSLDVEIHIDTARTHSTHSRSERVKQRTSESEKGASHLEEGGGGGGGGARSVTRREIHAAVSFAPLLLVFVLSAAPQKLGFNGQISSSHTQTRGLPPPRLDHFLFPFLSTASVSGADGRTERRNGFMMAEEGGKPACSELSHTDVTLRGGRSTVDGWIGHPVTVRRRSHQQ